MTNIDLDKVAEDFSGAILFDGAKSYKVIQATDFINFADTEVIFRDEVGYTVDSNIIYETTENSTQFDPTTLNKSTQKVNTLMHVIESRILDLTEYELQNLKERLRNIDR